MASRQAYGVALVAVGLVACAGCATPLSPMQRQELETRTYEAPLREVYSAARHVVADRGFWISESDFEGGLLTVSQTRATYSAKTALTLSILLPTAGDVYMNRYGWAFLDLLTWPYSIAWAAPSNYRLARQRTLEWNGSVLFEVLDADRTRVRFAFSASSASGNYPAEIRQLQEAIVRQLFLRHGDALGAAVPPAN